MSESQLMKRIRKIERELEEENWKYQSLFQQSQGTKADLSTLRGEMEALAEAMDVKTSQLLSLKKEQNEAARVRWETR